MLIDIHTHTKPWSGDSQVTAARLIEASKAAGLDGLCLTEHVWFWDHDDVAELSRKHGFLVLPGVEINTEAGHFLVFGLTKYVIGMQSTSFLKELVEAANGAMLWAHPYRGQLSGRGAGDDAVVLERAGRDPLVRLCNGIEVLNGRSTALENDFARALQQRAGLPAAGGGDVHSVQDVGLCATEFESPVRNLGEFIAEVRAGRFHAVDLKKST